MRRLPFIVVAAAVVTLACCSKPSRGEVKDAPAPSSQAPATPAETWVRGDLDERFAQVAKHLRGFDVAMVETGYRYGELYWAGRDGNWEYALYQLGKIETAVANGIERRPKRAASARMLEEPVQALKAVLESRDTDGFDPEFATLTATCNACHAAEQVAFIRVATPTVRTSPVSGRAPAPEDGR